MLKIEAPAKLNLFTVPDVFRKTVSKIKKNDIINYDLSHVNEIDTAGVAFLLELKIIANQNKTQIEFSNAPTHLFELSKLYKIAL